MENSNEDSREIIQMKRLPLCLNLFNMWMADRAWVLKFLPFQGRVMTKNTGLVHSARYLASHCFRLPFLKKKKKKVSCTHLILQEGCCLEINYYGM